jgi:RHS repeat-associated protein
VTDADGVTLFDHSDWLGTVRFRNVYASPSVVTCTSLPFGDALSCVGNDLSTTHFTGKERDGESGLDNFGARYNGSSIGRFMSTDPYDSMLIRQGMKAGGLSEAAADTFFDGFLENPQDWNKYLYALNNPLRFIDPNGAGPREGHHLIPERENLGAIGKAFADRIKTGALSGNGVPNQPGFNLPHRAYNDAVKALLEEAEETDGPSSGWTLQQWKDFANKVLNSNDEGLPILRTEI